MKNKIFVSVAIGFALVIIGGAIFMLFQSNEQLSIREFDVAKYQWEIENFPYNKNVGQVNDVNTAIEKAKELWIEKYSIVNGQAYDPIKERKCEAYFDNYNNCWLVKTSLRPNTKESIPHAIIRKDGTVIAVWMG